MSGGDIVRAVLAELAPEDRAAVAGVVLVVKELPDGEDLARGCLPGQYAAFWGVGRELGAVGGGPLPDPAPARGVITLFLRNLAPLTPERVRIALVHELAHALGWDEDTIQAMGLHLGEGGDDACCG